MTAAEPGLHPQQAGYRNAKVWSRATISAAVRARARALGAAGFRHPLRDLDLVRRIFYNNCFKTHPADPRLQGRPRQAVRRRRARRQCDADRRSPNQEIRGPDGGVVEIRVDAFRKHCLVNGLDDIGLTMEKKSSIDAYEAKAKAERAWA